MVPTWTGKPGKIRKLFTVREKSGNFTQNTGKMNQFLFYFFSDFLIEVCLLNRFLYFLNSLDTTPKKYWKMERKYWKSQGKPRKFVGPKMWEPCYLLFVTRMERET